MNIYEDSLVFKGEWRKYQKRILDKAKEHKSDNKFHIVAAPGSGKTTLGIELIINEGHPSLILSPTITIRQQWLSRIKEGFLNEGEDPNNWLSNNIKEPSKVTAITYQALHSATTRYKGQLDDENDEIEEVDFTNFNLKKTIKIEMFKPL